MKRWYARCYIKSSASPSFALEIRQAVQANTTESFIGPIYDDIAWADAGDELMAGWKIMNGHAGYIPAWALRAASKNSLMLGQPRTRWFMERED